MALNSILQDDFAGGLYRGKRAPANAVFDIVNGLINDEGQIYKRGGSAYKSNANAGDTLVGLFDGYLAAGQRTLGWTALPNSKLAYTLSSDDETPFGLQGGVGIIDPCARGAVVAGVLYLPASASDLPFTWGGARKTNGDQTFVAAGVTNGSTTITASGTSWLSKYDKGSIVQLPGLLTTVVTVNSDTNITLATPWTGATGTESGAIYNFILPDTTGGGPRFVATSGSPARLWYVIGNNRAYYSDRGAGGGFALADNYVELASASYIIGADSFRDELCLFSTDGIWTVANTALDPVDDFGNIAWTQSQVSREFVLWGDPGIASYSGTLVVPGVDDVCLFNGSSLQPITGSRGSQYDGGIRDLYRGYVSAGYQPGTASVLRSHYLLPIVDGTTLVDMLVCRLDHGFAWSRWTGNAASIAYARRAGSTTRSPKLLGISGERVTDLTGCFDPSVSNTTDADGTSPDLSVTTRDYPTSQRGGFVQRARLRYELDAPTGPLAAPWIANPWGPSTQVSTFENSSVYTGTGITRSYLSNESETAPLALAVSLLARPDTNVDSSVYCPIGFMQSSGNGYEARLRFESAADTVTIERYDAGARTRIGGPVSLAGRATPGDHFEFRVATNGTLTVLINGSSVATASDTTYFHAGEIAHPVIGVVDVALTNVIEMSTDLPLQVDVPVTIEYGSDADGDVWTELTDRGEQGGGDGWTVSDGSKYQWATVGKRRERIRFRVTETGACASFVLRSIEHLVRASGKQ